MKNIYGNQISLSRRSPERHRLSISSEPALSKRKPFSTACLNKVRALKELVTKQLAAQYGDSLSATLIRQAVQEADALAATTLFSDLFLPVLAEEKVQSAYAWRKRQERIHQETVSFAT
jgi:hypothetical protein